MTFEKQNFVVVGAGSAEGIGSSFVRQLLSIGVENVAIFDIISESVDELKRQYPDKTILYQKVDVRERVQIENAFKEAVKTFGNVDVMANFAGISDERQIDKMICINLFGVIYGTMAAIEHMGIEKGGRGGMIINMASILGLFPTSCAPVYCASKYGVIGFTRSLAGKRLESELGITFVAVCPGGTETKLLAVSGPKLFGKHGLDEFSEFVTKNEVQTPEECAKSLIKALKESENGSVWILEKGLHKPVTF